MSLLTSSQIGTLIQGSRKQRGLTQQDLAELVGVGRQWISDVENGKPRAELELVLKTLRALGIELNVKESPSSLSTSVNSRLPSPDSIVEAARYRKARDLN